MTHALPDTRGFWGSFGGQFVPETLMPALEELDAACRDVRSDPTFQDLLRSRLADYVGRPTPLYFAHRLSEQVSCRVYLKREDLTHTGAHKINNTVGQILLAQWMGKRRIIAETGAGQHGVAVATACALAGLDCVVYMGSEDIRRQRANMQRMRLLGADVRPVDTGSRTLKDAINEAIRDWVTNVRDTFYCLGSVVGPHPYPQMVRGFQAVIGTEARSQILEKEKRLPDLLVACVGGGSNAAGLFVPFLGDNVRMVGVEAGGRGTSPGEHGASLCLGRPGVLHGARSMLLQDADGQVLPTHSVSAGLDYPGVGPEHAYLHETGRVTYTTVSDTEALKAFHRLAELEGILPALESAHAIAYVLKQDGQFGADETVIVNLSGRGDKDLEIVEEPG